ncbi:MAG TPA: ABC transporter substrate-binding protein, partial [Candidatus Saccharimonadia bacterium]|nr:ABC transporter substrate-binding protein [Candidatus Saccharimonadia bacterium]
MGIFAPCRRQRRVLRDARCGGRLRGLLVIVGLLVAMPAPLHAAEQPERGGTIVWAVHESMPSFDLHYDNSYIAGQPIGPLYNGLLTFDVYQHEQIIGDLAERWDVAPDGKRITFALRTGVTFHDGSAFTCADAQYSLAKLADPKRTS